MFAMLQSEVTACCNKKSPGVKDRLSRVFTRYATRGCKRTWLPTSKPSPFLSSLSLRYSPHTFATLVIGMASINTTEGRAAREARINELFQLCKQLSSFDMENLEKEEARLRKEITADDRKKEEEKLRNNAQEHPTKAAYYELLLDKWSLSGDDSDAVSNTWMEWYFGPELMELISTPMETVENPKDDERSPKTLKGDKTESEAKEESDQAGEKASQSGAQSSQV